MNDLIWYLGWVAVACTALYLINRQRKSLKTDEIVNQEPAIMDLSGFRESMKVKSPLTEEDRKWLNKTKDSGLDQTIDWKNPEPKDYEGKKLNPFIQDEIGQFDPDGVNWKLRNQWTEFKERNPELFNTRKLENEYLNKPFVGYRTVLTGDVLNGVLFVEGADDSVLQYSLCDNIPPDGRYVVHGVVEKRNVLNVTEYQAVEC